MRSLSPSLRARRRGAALKLALSLALALAVAGAAPLGAAEKREARSLMDRFKKPPGGESDKSGERKSSSDSREKKRDTDREQDRDRDRDKDRDASRDRDRDQSKDRDRDSSRDRDRDKDRERDRDKDRLLWRDEDERDWRWNRYDRPYRPLGGYYGAGAAAPAVVYPAYTQPPRSAVSPPPAYDGGYYSDGYVTGQGYREGYRDYRSGGVQPGYGYSESRSWTGYAPPPPPPSLVRRAQSRLAAMGYYNGTADGVIGPRTRSAIERLQYEYRLPVTGELDDRTLRVLGI